MTTSSSAPDPFATPELPPKVDLFGPFGGFGVSFGLLGAPKTGKSDFAGSCAALGRTLVLAAKPREANSRLYVELGCDREVFYDADWAPSIGSYKADAYIRLLKRIHSLQSDDTYDFVIVDTFTDVAELASAELLKVENAATPSAMDNSQGFYGSLAFKLREVTKQLGHLQFAKHPKHVIIIAHTQPAKDDAVGRGGAVIKSADSKAKGVEFEGNVLPMIDGKYRYKFSGDLDMILFSDIDIKNELQTVGTQRRMVETLSYTVQGKPDATKHAGGVLQSAFEGKTLPNNFAAILDAVRASRTSK